MYNNKVYYFSNKIWEIKDSIYTIDINGTSNFVSSLNGLTVLYEATVIINNKLLMNTTGYPNASPIGNEPYYFDFATGTFNLLKDINPYFDDNSDVLFFLFQYLDTQNHNLVYFTAFHADYGRELWVTDGTPAGTNMVTDKTVGPLSGFGSPWTYYHGDSLFLFDADSAWLAGQTFFNFIPSPPSFDFGPFSDYWSSSNNIFFHCCPTKIESKIG